MSGAGPEIRGIRVERVEIVRLGVPQGEPASEPHSQWRCVHTKKEERGRASLDCRSRLHLFLLSVRQEVGSERNGSISRNAYSAIQLVHGGSWSIWSSEKMSGFA